MKAIIIIIKLDKTMIIFANNFQSKFSEDATIAFIFNVHLITYLFFSGLQH